VTADVGERFRHDSASLAGGLASDPAMPLVARIVQGAGVAALAPPA
jgi:hypothetical protein